MWRVLAVENRWIETGSWWTGAQVRAARGEQVIMAPPGWSTPASTEVKPVAEAPDDADLLDEVIVWRVEAANGLPGSRGVYELAHSPARGRWQLRGVMD